MQLTPGPLFQTSNAIELLYLRKNSAKECTEIVWIKDFLRQYIYILSDKMKIYMENDISDSFCYEISYQRAPLINLQFFEKYQFFVQKATNFQKHRTTHEYWLYEWRRLGLFHACLSVQYIS